MITTIDKSVLLLKFSIQKILCANLKTDDKLDKYGEVTLYYIVGTEIKISHQTDYNMIWIFPTIILPHILKIYCNISKPF